MDYRTCPAIYPAALGGGEESGILGPYLREQDGI